MVKFIHAADLHLDSPLRGLERYENAPVDRIRAATRGALANLVRLAIAQKVRFVLFAGDIYDGDWTDYNTGLHFRDALRQLLEAGIAVFMISGNHDAASEISRSLRLPGGATMLSVDEAQTIHLDDLGVAIHGRGFKKRKVTENVCKSYPPAEPGLFNIGMLHTSVAGYSGHDPYAPCSIDDMRSKEYGYWALGHIHQRIVLCEDPPIIFAGNIQGRHIRETGAKGCTVVAVDGDRIASLEHHDLDVMRWQICRANLPAGAGEDELYAEVSRAIQALLEEQNDLPLAARVEVACGAELCGKFLEDPERHIAEIRRVAGEAGRGRAWVEKVKVKAQSPASRDGLGEGVERTLLEVLEAVETDPELRRQLNEALEPLRQKLPQSIRQEIEGLELDDDAQRRQLLADVRQILIPHAQENEP